MALLLVYQTKNLPTFFGPEEDFLLHSNGLTLGFVNSLSQIRYKLDVDQMIKTVSLVKKLIQIGPIQGFTLSFKSAESKNYSKKCSRDSGTLGELDTGTV